jgi:hypothetical protein
MGTKGRRTSRAPLNAAPAEPPRSLEIPEPAKTSANAAKSAEVSVEPPEPAEVGGSLVFTPETSASQPHTVTPAKVTDSASADDLAHFSRDAFAALAQSQAALARGLEAMSAEMAGLALSGIDTAARTATKMLGIKTLADAIEVNAGFTCSSMDALLGGSAKLSELGVKLAAETSQPILTQFGRGWTKASRLGS